MKILIIRNYPSYMDIQYNTYNIQEIGLAKALIRRGHQCDIVFWAGKEEKTVDYTFDGDKHIRVYYRYGKNILKNAIYNNLDDLIKGYDVIQSCEYNQYQSWVLARKYPHKLIIYHGPYFSEFNKRYNQMCKIFDMFFLKRYINLGTKFIVKSNLACQFLSQKGIPDKNIKTIGVGLDLGALTMIPDKKVPEFIEKIDTFDDDIKLLYVGRFEERRNILFIYDVVKNLIERNLKVKLIMVGNGDKKYVDSCNNYAEKLGITDCIYKTVRLEQKYLSRLYEKVDIFLLPTRYEIFGMVLLESMYYGNLVITTQNGGSDILIKNGKNGIVVDCNANKWADQIEKMSKDSKLYKYICKEANEFIKNNYTWDCLVNKFIDVYNSISVEVSK